MILLQIKRSLLARTTRNNSLRNRQSFQIHMWTLADRLNQQRHRIRAQEETLPSSKLTTIMSLFSIKKEWMVKSMRLKNSPKSRSKRRKRSSKSCSNSSKRRHQRNRAKAKRNKLSRLQKKKSKKPSPSSRQMSKKINLRTLRVSSLTIGTKHLARKTMYPSLIWLQRRINSPPPQLHQRSKLLRMEALRAPRQLRLAKMKTLALQSQRRQLQLQR